MGNFTKMPLSMCTFQYLIIHFEESYLVLLPLLQLFKLQLQKLIIVFVRDEVKSEWVENFVCLLDQKWRSSETLFDLRIVLPLSQFWTTFVIGTSQLSMSFMSTVVVGTYHHLGFKTLNHMIVHLVKVYIFLWYLTLSPQFSQSL